jgi:hypothetical protein
VTIEQRTSPETRQALRQRYTPEPEPTCEICESPMVYRDTYGDGSQRWDCTVNDRHPQFGSWRVIGDPDVLAACDDADALAGALATVGRLRAALRNALDDFGIIYGVTGESERAGLAALQAAINRAHAALAPANATSDRTTEGAQ